MIDYLLPEVAAVSEVAAMHLCQANAMLRKRLPRATSKPKATPKKVSVSSYVGMATTEAKRLHRRNI
jgi:hypothetical protein